jgi:lipid A 4'-phosphatase
MFNIFNKFQGLNGLVYASIASSAIGLLILMLFPNLDIAFSKFFYNYQDRFIYKNNFIVQFFFRSIPIMAKTLFAVFSLYLAYLIIIRRKAINRRILTCSFYIMLSIAVGPGLLVNYIFKENFGRARPAQVKDFGGDKNFTRAFEYSKECAHNCSFSSGHAAMAYSFTNFAYIAPIFLFSRIYSIALLFGSLVGLSRVLMGGHFLSDILASCCTILTINHLLYLCLQKLKLIQAE